MMNRLGKARLRTKDFIVNFRAHIYNESLQTSPINSIAFFVYLDLHRFPPLGLDRLNFETIIAAVSSADMREVSMIK